jgi:hypothetical protein
VAGFDAERWQPSPTAPIFAARGRGCLTGLPLSRSHNPSPVAARSRSASTVPSQSKSTPLARQTKDAAISKRGRGKWRQHQDLQCPFRACRDRLTFRRPFELNRHLIGKHGTTRDGKPFTAFTCGSAACADASETWTRRDKILKHIGQMHPGVSASSLIGTKDVQPKRAAGFEETDSSFELPAQGEDDSKSDANDNTLIDIAHGPPQGLSAESVSVGAISGFRLPRQNTMDSNTSPSLVIWSSPRREVHGTPSFGGHHVSPQAPLSSVASSPAVRRTGQFGLNPEAALVEQGASPSPSAPATHWRQTHRIARIQEPEKAETFVQAQSPSLHRVPGLLAPDANRVSPNELRLQREVRRLLLENSQLRENISRPTQNVHSPPSDQQWAARLQAPRHRWEVDSASSTTEAISERSFSFADMPSTDPTSFHLPSQLENNVIDPELSSVQVQTHVWPVTETSDEVSCGFDCQPGADGLDDLMNSLKTLLGEHFPAHGEEPAQVSVVPQIADAQSASLGRLDGLEGEEWRQWISNLDEQPLYLHSKNGP